MAGADVPVLTPDLLRGWPLPEVDHGGSKRDRGTVLVLGGSVATPGAVLLAGLAALRVGAGRLQVVTVPETAVALGVALPEAMVRGVEGLAEVDLTGVDAVVVGPGATDDAGKALSALLPVLDGVPVVVDAGSLYELSDSMAGPAVLTPNVAELHHLAGRDGDNEGLAVQVARERAAVVTTHGCVAAPDGSLWRDGTGSVGLATSGSGDVLAGVVGGLLARGASPEQAACWGTYLHGAAGDRLVGFRGRLGGLARELLDELPHALASLTG